MRLPWFLQEASSQECCIRRGDLLTALFTKRRIGGFNNLINREPLHRLSIRQTWPNLGGWGAVFLGRIKQNVYNDANCSRAVLFFVFWERTFPCPVLLHLLSIKRLIVDSAFRVFRFFAGKGFFRNIYYGNVYYFIPVRF